MGWMSRLVLDQWAPLSYKAQLSETSSGGASGRGLGAPWMGYIDRRRITAYTVLRAYAENSARLLLLDNDKACDRREYGDADLLIESALSALLGDEQTVTVPDAENHNPDLPEAASADEKRKSDEALSAYQRQEWLRGWAKDVRLRLKLLAAERDAAAVGDGVYLLAWSAKRGRPVLRTYDPGFYFPVLDDDGEDEYPERVHLAWEEADPVTGEARWLRRITYELGTIQPATAELPIGARLRRLIPFMDNPDQAPALQPGDVVLDDGSIGRSYAWQEDEALPSTVTCYLTDARWALSDVDTGGLDDLSLNQAEILRNEDGELLDRLDLHIDFVPVVHQPNSYEGAAHFGRSIIASVLQVLDDLGTTDTDVAAAGSTTGTPPIALSGTNLPVGEDGTVSVDYSPGTVWGLGPDGKLSTVDTSSGLTSLRANRSDLQDRLSQNVRLPAAVLGRVKPNEVPSGFALALGFSPFRSLIEHMRLVREEKHPLLLKFAQRIAMAGYDPAVRPELQPGALEPGPVLAAGIELGPYLPNDIDAVVGRVVQLYAAFLVSLETALAMLIDAGLPIEDAQAEIDRIDKRNYVAANLLADAVGDQDAVREYLGLPKKLAVPPAPVLPLLDRQGNPVPPANPQPQPQPPQPGPVPPARP